MIAAMPGCDKKQGNYYFDEISRYLAIYISTILRPLTCSVVELIQLLLLYTERNAAVIS